VLSSSGEKDMYVPFASSLSLVVAHVFLSSAERYPRGYSAGTLLSLRMYCTLARISVGLAILPAKRN
jgi:poly(3-hydroxybutyrate) depolymerase